MNNNVFKNYIEKYSNILKFIVYHQNNNILRLYWKEIGLFKLTIKISYQIDYIILL